MRKRQTSRNKRLIYPKQRELNRVELLIYSDWIVYKYEEFDIIIALSPPFKIYINLRLLYSLMLSKCCLSLTQSKPWLEVRRKKCAELEC